jgi:hypothetical protein
MCLGALNGTLQTEDEYIPIEISDLLCERIFLARNGSGDAQHELIGLCLWKLHNVELIPPLPARPR